MNKSFNKTVDAFIKTGKESSIKELVDKVTKSTITNKNLAYLTEKCGKSNDFFVFSNDMPIVDIASTGGPSSLSTLLCPLYLRALGGIVPCLAVPGRPAGGIDVLSQIPGYKINLSRNDVLKILKKCGYVHLLAGKNFAPRDAELFLYRQKSNSQNNALLATVSLLSKKVAMGLNRVGLDVRVAKHGNFGSNLKDARKNAKRFCKVAELLDIKAVCFLTNAVIPYQPYIGRGEALIALSEIFTTTSSVWLTQHLNFCFETAKRTLGIENAPQPNGTDLRNYFEQNLVCQGSKISKFYQRVEEIKTCDNMSLFAKNEGFIEVDLHLIRSILVELQKKEVSNDNVFADNCGIKLEKTTGDYVNEGDLIANIRIENSLRPFISKIKNKFLSAFPLSHNPSTPKEILEVIGNE